MAQKLSQVVAVEKPTKTRVERFITDINKLLQKSDFFSGFNRSYVPIKDDDERMPPENKVVQNNVTTLLPQVITAMTDLWNVSATRDWANCQAKADIEVDGQVVLKDVPATFLLFLEKQLNDLHTLIGNVPVLDSAEIWTRDDNDMTYKAESRQTAKTKKVPKVVVLHPPTDKHPAQTQLVTDDIIVGHWFTTNTSGAMPMTRKVKILERIEKMQKAVKYARENANCTQAPDVQTNTILSWITAQ